MDWVITNNSRQLLTVPLNSGMAINLAPGEASEPLDEVETAANPKIEKLSNAGLISLARSKDRGEDDDGRGGAHSRPKKPKG